MWRFCLNKALNSGLLEDRGTYKVQDKQLLGGMDWGGQHAAVSCAEQACCQERKPAALDADVALTGACSGAYPCIPDFKH